jgi:energy-coupling factor transporter ATP-binding protein EcfA2
MGAVEPFGETLPLVEAVAWDSTSAQVAFIARESEPLRDVGEARVEPWRQLLFAASGLRHHLRRDGTPALATPIVFALVDGDLKSDLRELADDLAQDYALFTRVDLNLIDIESTGDPDALDRGLAPMLPCVRRALRGQRTVAPADIDQFWKELQSEIDSTASNVLTDVFVSFRGEAVHWLERGLQGSPTTAPVQTPLRPIVELGLDSFRSFADERIRLGATTVIEGHNGSGKSSIIEALELLWAGATQRMPTGEDLALYTAHLGHEGEEFHLDGTTLEGDRLTVSRVEDVPGASLHRNVLTQESMEDLASLEPARRFKAFLRATGLELPDLAGRLEQLARDSVSDLNEILGKIGAKKLPSIATKALEHTQRALRSDFAARLPAPDHVSAMSDTLAQLTNGGYMAQPWAPSSELQASLVALDNAFAGVAATLDSVSGAEAIAGAALDALSDEIQGVEKRIQPIRRLVDAMSVYTRASNSSPGPKASGPLPHSLAIRWSSHAQSLITASSEFEAHVSDLEDAEWRQRLMKYAEILLEASSIAHVAELQSMVSAGGDPAQPQIVAEIPPDLFLAAGFQQTFEVTQELIASTSELWRQMNTYHTSLTRLREDIEAHPGHRVAGQEESLAFALARCELSRNMRLARSPVARASTSLVEAMLQERLFPVVRELVTALTRFEWYFEDLQVAINQGEIELKGLSTTAEGLDIRLLLNAAERDVVGIAWFLSLHLMQARDERRVLVIDDPAEGFDAVNRAGFVSTLRTLVRLARPEQVILTTHDELLADLFEEELAPVAGWPIELVRVRCRRDRDALSVANRREVAPANADLDREERMLGLKQEAMRLLN